jgi:8-amino-7-oxononanoate synthase
LDLFAKTKAYTKPKMAEAFGIYPYFVPIESEAGPEVIINGETKVMLGSNNYLGLTQHPKVKEAARAAVERYGSGCTGSRLMNGTLDLHVELERRLANWMQRDAALVFTTGFQANLGTISALVGRHDTVVIDRADHASIVDGCRLALGDSVRFKHNDLEDLERVLQKIEPGGGILIVVDGVYSMEGDLAELPGIVELAKKYGARILVDEAHSAGVFGDQGRGTADHFGVRDEIDLIMTTFSKSFASIGGFIAADADVIYFIKHNGRAFLFSASLPPASTAAALAALDIIETEPDRRERLWANARRMKKELAGLGFNTGDSKSPVIPIIVGEEIRLATFWRRLLDAGVYTNAAVTPAVEPDRALIRTSYMATHEDKHLDRALEIFAKVGKQCSLI